jgi:hypothetical protein
MMHHYLSSHGAEIEQKRRVRELRVLIGTEATFDNYIAAIVAKGRQQMWRIWRKFLTREAAPMIIVITLFRALELSILEYCCQLWAPLKPSAVRQLQAVQRTFTTRISGMRAWATGTGWSI